MNSQVWALGGVIVGAILGGLAQILSEALRHRHERRNRLQDSRELAYSELLTLCDDVGPRVVKILQISDSMKRTGDGVGLFSAARQLAEQVENAQRRQQRVRLYGSRRAVEISEDLRDALGHLDVELADPFEIDAQTLLEMANRVAMARTALLHQARMEVDADHD